MAKYGQEKPTPIPLTNSAPNRGSASHLAMGQKPKPVPPVNIPIQPLKEALTWVVHLPTKMVPLVLTHSHIPRFFSREDRIRVPDFFL